MSEDTKNRLKRLERLKRLGVKKGTNHISPPLPKPLPTEIPFNTEAIPLHFLNYEEDLQHAAPIEQVISGQVISNEHGEYFNVEARYPLNGIYGTYPLRYLLDVPMDIVATMTNDETWLELNWEQVLFIDTETTGLELAAGTIAFLIGIGYLEGNDFVVRQVFMRDFNEEQALLHDLHTLCEDFEAIVSFNGKTFDVPLLENRFIIARLFPDLFDGPHFDLLHSARRLWRRRLDNCKLITLEEEILGLTRSQADIPGYFIPSLYRKYLVDQDARVLAGIFYHNELDIVSMAAVAAILGHHFAHPNSQPMLTAFNELDLLSLGLWQLRLGENLKAEKVLQEVLTYNLPPEEEQRAMTELAYLLKREGRLVEAEALWQMLAAVTGNLLALEELAKYYEWHIKDLDKALTCIDHALKYVRSQPVTWSQREDLATWEHRQARVVQKKARWEAKS